MAISFSDSLKKATASMATISAYSLEASPVMESLGLDEEANVIDNTSVDQAGNTVISYDLTNENTWTRSDAYLWYDDYSDDKLSTIDEKKNITVNQDQINITQETNSQFIPFQMPRYYDGFDLMKTNLLVHFVNKNNDENYSSPVNVSYNDNYIRFAWLVNKNATAIEGVLKFEIQAVGTNSKGNEYIWKTQPNGKLNILQSLSGNGIVEPDSSWLTSFMTNVNEKVAEAQTAAQNAANSVTEVQQYAEQAANSAQSAQTVVNTAKVELEQSVETAVNEKVTAALANYYTSEQIDEIIANIDISDQLTELEQQITDTNTRIDNIDGLADFNVEYDGSTMTFYNGETIIKEIKINSDPSVEWTTAYTATIESKIDTAKTEVQTNLDTYKTITDADLASIHKDIDGLPETLQTDYYNKEDIDTLLLGKANQTDITSINSSIATVESTVNTNNANISTLGEKITELETTVGGIDQSPRLTYDITYDETNTLTLEEIEGEGTEDEIRTAKSQFVIQGGGGGSSTSSILKIEYVTKTPVVATVNDTVIITYNFSGTDSSGDDVLEGTATWRVAGSVVATNIAVNGENSFDITNYLSLGTQKVVLSITDDAGSLVTKTWTVQKIDIRLESTFNDQLTYPLGTVSFDYTPYGAIAKDVHFILDGTEIGTVTTSASGIPMAYTIPEKTHGSHLLDAYITAVINNITVESNHITKDIIWYDSASDIPVISCIQQSFTARQYDTTNIIYTVYDPKTETPEVTLAVDGVVISTLTLDNNTQIWQYKSTEVGAHTLTITCGNTVKTLNVTIEKLDINIEPVTANLAFDFDPSGKSNNDTDRLWSDGEVAMTVSDNFDWTNGGYQIDENGDQYFCVKTGTSAVINYQLFADDAKRNGKEFKLVFKTTNVRKADATFLTCQSGSVSQIGLEMNVHEAYVKASTHSLYLPYSEEDLIEFEFNINKDTDELPIVSGYEDGVPTRPMLYTSDSSFTQINPVPITIGSENCDVRIYRMKAYSTSLTDRGILNNFIADARNAEEMISRYNRSQIYDENNLLTPETLAEKCPWLRVIKLEAPHFTNNKSDKVKESTIEMIYKNGDSLLDNWKALHAGHSGQGTTSNEYGQAGRNLDFIMNYSDTEIILGDGITKAENGKISLTRNSVPVNYLNFKINVASSEGGNNALLQKRYNRYLPYQMPAQKRDPRVKNSMEFFNCVVFIKESDPDVTTHREFSDCEWHFYGLGNIGDSKKTDNTRVNDPNDPKEFVVEIMDNTLPNSTFSGTTEALTALDADQFDEDGTYGFRYEMKGITDEQRQTNMQIWRNFYRFVATSSNEEFKANLKNWFIVDSALYFYLFTERYTMIDNRAKNTFWHWSKVYISQTEAESLGDESQYYTIDDTAAQINDGYRFELWDYDNDTGLGINNSGELTMTYGKEDTDYRTEGDPNSGYVFNAAESKFFCRIRDLFPDELNTMFVDRESANAWSATGLINEFDEWQAQFPEELWRLHFDRVYFRTYREGTERFVKEMMNGLKKYHRRQFDRDQEKYMATKHYGNVAIADQIMFRCNTPTQATVAPDYTLHLTPYADMYLSVMFGATYRTQVRAKAGKQYDIICPFTTMDDTAVLIYCSSQIQAIGDLSRCYIHDNDFSKASRLQELIIGNATEGYQNTFLTNLGIGNNTLLKKLDIQNTPNLAQALNLTACGNLEELYAHGSGLTGVTFADGGKIRIAELPAITSITMRNLTYLTGLDIAAFNNLTTLIVENCGTVDVKDFFTETPNINRVRITGINWTLENTDLLDRIYNMSGIDKNGYNISQSVLAGSVHVPVMREKLLSDYTTAWPDLEITYDTLVQQYSVTFVNHDGTVLDVQYVDKGEKPVDPVTRTNNPIAIPVRESSISTDYTYSGWDTPFIAIFENQTITATYSETVRKYTIRYISKGTVLQESTSEYGTNVFYIGDTPTYTAEESAYKYYLFSGWDQSGFVNGNKDVNAVYDICEYNSGYFDNKDLSTMRPVEIYALTKLGMETSVVESKDSFSFNMGNDYNYDDIKSNVITDSTIEFTGSNHLDTGIQLFDTDKDFVLAIDYEFSSGNTINAVLAQCFQTDGSNGFKLLYNSYPRIQWGTSSIRSATGTNREMLVLRHIAGETTLHVYLSNLTSSEINIQDIERTRETLTDATLVFGCLKADDGAYESHAIGKLHWAKVWFADLGDTACQQLAAYIHEKVTMEMCGFKRKYLSDNSSKRCSMSFLAANALNTTKPINSQYTNEGGWANATLNTWLNTRFLSGVPISIRQLIKQVKVSSSIGGQSTEISSSDCYIYVPAIYELSSTMTEEPYSYEDTPIDYMISNDARIRTTNDGTAVSYWTRSPNKEYSAYFYSIRETGATYGYSQGPETKNVVIEFSI